MRAIVTPAAAALILTMASLAAAQNESGLRSYFEGRRVTLKIDMPGSSDGVDVRVDASRPIDFRAYGERLKEYGTAIRTGESATVTLVKVKKDLIEFQLNGGGFGTFGDDTSTSVYMPLVEKSKREKELEARIKEGTDHRLRRDMEDELDALRARRERENHRIEAEKTRAEEFKKERIADQRLRGGSRFNLRYSGAVPAGIRPEEVMAALADYVDFSGRWTPARSFTSDIGLWKGMMREDAESLLGEPDDVSDRHEGELLVTRLVFVTDEARVAADFVEDVLVRYTVTPRR
jgi:hypothetical protein